MTRKIIVGIYKITNILNEKFYIGSSYDIHKRWREHKNSLRKGKHHSIHLQRAWDKYGEENFTFEILMECTEEDRLQIEQEYLDKTKCFTRDIGYNVSANATGSFSKGEGHWLGKQFSDEHRDNISKVRKELGLFKGKNNPMYGTEGTKSMLGKNHSEESKKKMSESAKKLSRKGEKNPVSKLTDKQREELYQDRLDGMTYKELSEKYGVGVTTVQNVINKFKGIVYKRKQPK